MWLKRITVNLEIKCSYELICYLRHKKLAQRLYMKLFEDATWYSSTRTEAVLMPELNEMGS